MTHPVPNFSSGQLERELIGVRCQALRCATDAMCADSIVFDGAIDDEILRTAKRFEHYLATGETVDPSDPNGGLDASTNVG